MSYFTVFGFDLKQERYDALGYYCETPAEAAAKAREHYPNFEIYSITSDQPQDL